MNGINTKFLKIAVFPKQQNRPLSLCIRPQCSLRFVLLYAECISCINTLLELRAGELLQLLLSATDASDGS